MRNLILFSVLILFTVCLNGQTIQKTGYVDSQVILTQLPEAIKAQSDLEATAAEWRKTLDSMATELQTAYADYQKQQATMTPEKQREIQQGLILKQQAAENFNQEKFGQNGELYVQQERLLGPIKDKIFDAIDVIAKEEGMHFVFDKAGDVILLYADPEFDITYKVLDRLKRGKQK